MAAGAPVPANAVCTPSVGLARVVPKIPAGPSICQSEPLNATTPPLALAVGGDSKDAFGTVIGLADTDRGAAKIPARITAAATSLIDRLKVITSASPE